MIAMAEKKPPADRHKNKPLQLRLHPLLRRQLKALAEQKLTTATAEATQAIRQYLEANGLWPPPK